MKTMPGAPNSKPEAAAAASHRIKQTRPYFRISGFRKKVRFIPGCLPPFLLHLQVDPVAHAPDGFDQLWVGGVGLHFFPEPLYIDGEGIVVDKFARGIPDFL